MIMQIFMKILDDIRQLRVTHDILKQGCQTQKITQNNFSL